MVLSYQLWFFHAGGLMAQVAGTCFGWATARSGGSASKPLSLRIRRCRAPAESALPSEAVGPTACSCRSKSLAYVALALVVARESASEKQRIGAEAAEGAAATLLVRR